MPPADIGEYIEKLNIRTLRTQLNSGHCFDVVLDHQENDILELHFTCKSSPGFDHLIFNEGNYLVYAFAYKKGKWKKTNYDPFGNNMDEVRSGKISSPFGGARHPMIELNKTI